MKWIPILAALLAARAGAQSVARIDGPAPGALAGGGSLAVQVTVQSPHAGYWLLLDRHEGGPPAQLAAGSGDVAPGSTVFQGTLAPGQHRLELELHTSMDEAADAVELVSAAAMLPGWPFQERLAATPSSLSLMAEGAHGEAVVARNVGAERFALDFGELVWLNGQGAPLPGWPVGLSELGQALSVTTEPILLERGGQVRLLASSKTHLLEFGRDGALLAQAPFGGLPLGPPVLLPLPQGQQTLVFAAQQGSISLLRFDADLEPAGAIPLPGLPAWPRPVLGDMDGDGWLDLLVLARVPAGIEVLVVNGRSGALGSLATLPNQQLVSAATGDLDGDGSAELLVAGRHAVQALGQGGVLWTRDYPDLWLGAAELADAEDDGLQECAFLARDGAGALRFHLLDAQGADLPVCGALVAAEGEALHAPQLVRAPGQTPRFLLTVSPGGVANWSTRFAWIDAQGALQQPGWLVPGVSSGPPRLLDLDGDGELDLLAGDGYGRWSAWPTGLRDLDPPHPLGDARHGGVSVQPLGPGAVPGLLCGRVAIAGEYLLPDSVGTRDLLLARGTLRVNAPWAPEGRLWVGPSAGLRLEPGAGWTGATPRVEVEGLLAIAGAAAEVADLPHINSAAATNGLLAGMELRLEPGAHLDLSNCILHDLAQPLTLDRCRLDMRDSWLLAGARGLVIEGGELHATECLFQPDETGLQLHGGALAVLRDCVITSGPGTAIDNQASQLELRNCQLLACQDAVAAGAGSVTLLDSVHFQGNRRDLLIAAGHAGVELTSCDFVETHEVGVQNQSVQPVTALGCYWHLQRPTLGAVTRVSDSATPIKPAVIPAPVFRVDPGPMVDGDEPLEWLPVEFSVGGIPIAVEYRVYRSEDPYDVLRPENLVVVTPSTRWADPDYHSRCFYCVTASFGKQVVH